MKNILIIIINCLVIFSCSNTSNPTISIGKEGAGNKEQVWMVKNLDVTTYRDGTEIPEVKDPVEWAKLTTGAWCYYNNNPANGKIYGKLYNWYAVNDPRGLAPEGFHIPSADEWNALTDFLSISSVDYSIGDRLEKGGTPGLKMKEIGNSHWAWGNEDATNSSGFTGLPGGIRFDEGNFNLIRIEGQWWSSTEKELSFYYNAAFKWSLNCDSWGVDNYYYNKRYGLSVRCIKD
jgi:uncharacterized protein (TIGR02145 family)